ncbi:MAG: YitT family protein [Phycisphaerales bacterium]
MSRAKRPPIRIRPIDAVFMVFAGMVYAIALKYFVFPSGIILTGTEGIAVSIAYYFDRTIIFIVLYALFQVSLLTFAYKKISRGFAIRSAIVVATVITLLFVLPDMAFADPAPQNERITLVLFAGIIAGFAKAVAFKHRGSTGDEDIIAAHYAMKYLRPVGSIAIIAGVVSTAFGLLLQYLKVSDFPALVNTLMYTSLYIFVSAQTLNAMYHKFKITMLVVIDENPEKVGEAIRKVSPHRTYTVQSDIDGRLNKQLKMVRTIITREELPRVLESVRSAAPNSFYYHHELEGVSRKFYITPIG